MSDDLAHRVARLEAKEATCLPQYQYSAVWGPGNSPVEMVKLFTGDAVWNSGDRLGVHRGRDAIHTYVGGISGVIRWALHYMVKPVVDLTEDLRPSTRHGLPGSRARCATVTRTSRGSVQTWFVGA